MTERANAFDAAIDDLRALMDALIASDWQNLHIADGDSVIFLSKEGDRVNPMLMNQSVSPDLNEQPRNVATVAAPHVATVASVEVALGDHVAANTKIATLSVLDEEVAVLAPHAGLVVEVGVTPGDLVEFGTALVRLAEDDR